MTAPTSPSEPAAKITQTLRLERTTRTKLIEGGHISVQMLDHCTLVQVSDVLGGRVTRAHLFRVADHVEIERGVAHG